jgi:hypothetical protein
MTNAAKELDDEDGGLGLHLGAIDPLQQRGLNLCSAGESEQCERSEACGQERAKLAERGTWARASSACRERCEWSFCLYGWLDASDGKRAVTCVRTP